MTSEPILVFGSVGTEIYCGTSRYELVVLSETGETTWRGKCVVCRTPIFVPSRGGKIAAVDRCSAHRARARHIDQPPGEAEHAAQIQASAAKHKPEAFGMEDFLPLRSSDFEVNLEKINDALDTRVDALAL